MVVLAQERRLVAPPAHCYRVLIAIPSGGFGVQLELMRAWLDAACGRGGWASAPAGTGGILNSAIAFYFARESDARAFVARFGCGYRGRL